MFKVEGNMTLLMLCGDRVGMGGDDEGVRRGIEM